MRRLAASAAVLSSLLLGAASPSASSAQELRSELGILEAFLGTAWEGRFEDADEPLGLSMRWEVILDGEAVRMDGRSSGMSRTNLYYWDAEQRAVAYLALSSNGFVGRGTIRMEDSVLVAEGRQAWPDGSAHDTMSRWELLPGGRVRVVGYGREGGEWVPGHKILYTPLITRGPEAAKLGELEGVSEPHSLQVVGDDLVFLDGFTVRVFGLDPLEPKRSFGGEGEGPNQFRYRPNLAQHGDTIIGTDYLKTSWFSPDGGLLRILPYSDFEDFDTGMEMVLTPVGKNFMRITVDHESSRRFVQLLDSALRPIADLYEGLYDWQGALPPFRVDVDADERHIVASDSERGFFISLFDTEGTLLRTIDRSEEMEPVPFTAADRDAYLATVRENEDPRLYEHLRQSGRFKDYYPMINHVQIDGDRLYVTTDRRRGDDHEMIVLDLEGRTVRTLFLPLRSMNRARRILRFDPYVVHQGRLYEIVKDDATGVFELWVTDLGV